MRYEAVQLRWSISLSRSNPDIRTGKANSNAPMLKINNELGFKPYMSQVIWQVETEKVAEY
jgi:hypothetical protein